ncbi:MAG: DUF2341 domain-containing protein [Chitinophagales bacterium]|nr:DUF2341 domain-containing protein [Chitinophagales bacterium]MDW8418356.1 DUF2341 domain-containing protein [Chitinophagales bacterium]
MRALKPLSIIIYLILIGTNTIRLQAQSGLCCPYVGWDYILPIEFTNQTGAAMNNLQIPFIINTATPISQGKMKPDGSDIRFYINCGQYLDYWIEGPINTANTKIWVRIPNLADGATVTIYMKYGNPTAAAVSNQTALFPNVVNVTGNISGVITADWINVTGNVTMNAGQPAVLNARKIVFNANFNGAALGYGPQSGPGAGINGNGSVGGSGGSYGGMGGSGGGAAPVPYGTPNGPDIDMGSGGGGSDCGATASGGGAITLRGADVVVDGSINVRGGDDQYSYPGTECCCGPVSEAAGGGAGGGVLIEADHISGSATINASGGNGGNSDDKESGGGGGGGRVKFRWCQSISFNGNVNVSGGLRGPSFGQGGSQNGQPGTNTQPQTTCYTINILPEQPVSIPTASFTFTSACLGGATNFTNTSTSAPVSTNLTSNWNFGDGTTSTQTSPTKTYAAASTYTVTLTVTSQTGCTSTATQQVSVAANPVANFTANTPCENNPVQFTDASSGSPTQWSWNFGGGNTSNLQNPSFTFTGHGSFPVTLTVSNAGGCSASVTKNVTVNPGVTAAFSFSNACEGTAVTFTNSSSASAGSISSYQWNFGNGQTSGVASPTHTYNLPGAYPVRLVVQSSNGCTDTLVQSVEIFPKPNASFTVSPVCNGEVSQFNDASTVSSGVISQWNWNFGGGATSTLQNPTHQFGGAGSYPVTLIVSTGNCSDTVTQQAVVHPAPVVNFQAPPVCLPSPAQFTNQSSVASGSITQYNWDFGDGNTSTQQSPSHTYAGFGTYNVTLTVTTNNGCSESITKPVQVNAKPVAAFSATAVCLNQPTVFTDASNSPGSNIQNYQWNFGNGQSSNQSNPSHTYSQPGNYTVTLTVTDQNGCTDDTSVSVTVHPLPAVSFAANAVCVGETTLFTNNSSIASGTITGYQWNFGDGSAGSTQSSPSHTYNAAGSYNVTLVATSDNGCTASATQSVTVNDNPQVVVTGSEICYGASNGTVSASATGGSGSYNYNWSNAAQGATISNLSAGTYTVTVTDANGCTATGSATVTQPSTPFEVSSEKEVYEILAGQFTPVTLNSNYNPVVWTVYPPQGISCNTCAQFEAYPLKTITYTVTATDDKGCTASTAFVVKVKEDFPTFIPNVFTPNADGANDVFKVYTTAVKYFQLRIFNRSGEKVFETFDVNDGWDGNYRQAPAPPGVYVYEAVITHLNNVTEKRKGSVTLMR